MAQILIFLGPPGAGKGTNTAFILKARGLTCPPIVVRALLDSPEAQRLKNAQVMNPTYTHRLIVTALPVK